ncbi:glycosyltransferase family 1 protein [Citrobacter freundii complex sp. 2023EL-00966]|uniref:glycosyltransferase family 4 protein n=3 Tax=Citrobacter TaxID=544 RepID=UPI0028960148|nr:glycosyltransferase family 1 protein [Citrobacter freundii complex sp. 2023EL-00966]MDT3754979.1 glycosyltransferase family 1 protein [Citrobacter freundii complex sp. 2023EL-00966]
MEIIIDLRLINHSGIGRYLKSLIPELFLESEATNELLITTMGDERELSQFNWFDKSRHIQFTAKPFSVKEQLFFFKIRKRKEALWVPHFNVPFFIAKNQKLFVTVHDVYPLAGFESNSLFAKLYLALTFRTIKKHAVKIFTVSEFSKNEIIVHARCNADKIIPILLGPPKLPFVDPNIKPDFKYILYVGNIKRHKNLRNSILAFKKAHKYFPDIKFLIIGNKENLRTSDIEVDDLLNTTEGVLFTGYIDDKKLAFYYANCELLLFPSMYEGFGLPVLEALSFERQVITSNVASLPEVGGDAVHYVCPYDVNNISDVLLEVLNNRRKISNADMHSQLRKFSWKNVAKSYLREF